MKILVFITLFLVSCGEQSLPKDQCVMNGSECQNNEPNDSQDESDVPINGIDGKDGKDGIDGKNGTNGVDGQDGTNGQDGQDGTNGIDGTNGTNGKSIVLSIISVPTNRDLTPWTTNNRVLLTYDGIITVPSSFTISSLSGTSGSGWIDFKVGNEVYCYKRVTNTKDFVFSYKKILNTITDCDSDSDKDLNPTIFSTRVLAGQYLQVIPRESRMAGIGVVIFSFNYQQEQ